MKDRAKLIVGLPVWQCANIYCRAHLRLPLHHRRAWQRMLLCPRLPHPPLYKVGKEKNTWIRMFIKCSRIVACNHDSYKRPRQPSSTAHKKLQRCITGKSPICDLNVTFPCAWPTYYDRNTGTSNAQQKSYLLPVTSKTSSKATWPWVSLDRWPSNSPWKVGKNVQCSELWTNPAHDRRF